MKSLISKLLALSIIHLLFVNVVAASVCSSDSASYDMQQGKLSLPAVFVEQTGFLFAVELDLLASQKAFQFQLSDLNLQENSVSSGQDIYQPDKQLLTIKSLCLLAEQSEQLVTQIEMQLIPYSEPLQFLLKSARDSAGKPIFNWAVAQNKGDIWLGDRQRFDQLAITGDVSGVVGVRELKFVIVDLDDDNPVLFFMDSSATPLHYDFLRDVLKRYQHLDYDQGMTQFGADSYFRENRRHLAGSIVAYDHYKDSRNSGLYTMEFWPTDPVPAKLIEQAYHMISAAMPFLTSPLAYHPVGNTHEQEYQAFADQFAVDKIRTILTDELFAQLDTAILNKGEAYGRLKVINPGDPDPGEDTIAIYTFIPNVLGHVGGIITEEPQTPLSHINLKARQNDTPNARVNLFIF